METAFWRKCSSCKKPIGLGARYYTCSVSTCNGQRTGYVFCSVSCFEVHLPGARHKDAAAMEERAPMKPADSSVAASTGAGDAKRSIVRAPGSAPTPQNAMPREVLIIASRLKEYIHARAEMNTAGQVMEILSDHVRILCERAIDHARSEGRKTVLERDFDFLKK